MRIGEIAAHAGVNVQTLRYYERRRLLAPPNRRPSGYRDYDRKDLQRVRFIRRAQALGFTLQEIGEMLALSGDAARSPARVAKRASHTLLGIEKKIDDLRRLRTAVANVLDASRARRTTEPWPLLAAFGSEGNTED